MKIIRTLDGSHIEATVEELARWKEDPVAFVQELIGRELSTQEAEAIREQARMVEYDEMMNRVGFSIRGMAPRQRATSAQLAAAVIATTHPALPSPEELADELGMEEWTYAAPDTDRSRQAFKGIANRRRKKR